jgi:FkbM family methyltransferase
MKAITYSGRTVTFPDLPAHAAFFDKLAAGRWDSGLFKFIDRFVDERTVYIDIGAWLGVSPFWAAQRAKKVIAVEPDPVCLRALEAMQPLNRAGAPVTIVAAALSNDAQLTLRAVEGLGSSMTSAVRAGSGSGFSARGVSIQQLINMAEGAPLCLKIDIEGYEYHLVAQLAGVPAGQTKGVLVSLHPRFYLGSLSGGLIARRAKTAAATLRVARALKAFRLTNPQALARVLFSLAFQRRPVHRDLIFVAPRQRENPNPM